MNEICATQVKLVRNPRYKERFSKAGREAVKFARGFAKGVWLGLKDMVKDSWEMIKNPGKIVKGTIDMLRKPIKTFKAMLNFGKELAKEFIGGDSEKKGEMIGKVSAEIIVDVAITKGIGKLKQLKHVNKIAGKIKDVIKKSPPMVAMAPLYKKGRKKLKGKIQEITKIDKVNDLASDIRKKIDNTILNKMEDNGGHFFDRHAGKDNNYLIKRAIKERAVRDGATTFYNKKAALAAIKENIRGNADKIAEWVSDPNSRMKVTFTVEHSKSVGKGVKVIGESKKSASKVYDKLNKSTVVLIKSSDSELGFNILTAFPEF